MYYIVQYSSYFELIYLYFLPSFHIIVVFNLISIDNLASQAKMYTKYLNMKENKGKLILTEIFPSVQKQDI